MDLASLSAFDDLVLQPHEVRYRPAGWMSGQGLDMPDDFKLASFLTPGDGDGPVTGLTSPSQSHKRNASLAGFDSSPASVSIGSPDPNGDEHGREGKRRPVKRACNECRQQKVSAAEFSVNSTVPSSSKIAQINLQTSPSVPHRPH